MNIVIIHISHFTIRHLLEVNMDREVRELTVKQHEFLSTQHSDVFIECLQGQ
jgi:hypothetical protein